MERRYLVATLALVATFAIFSQAFGSGRLAKLPRSRAEAQADIACVRRTVAERIMAKLAPYVDSRAPEQAQMVAELNLPELARVEQQAADAQRMAETQVARQQCQAAMRAQKAAQQIYKMQILTSDRAQRMNDLSAARAEELSARAQAWRDIADARRIQIDVEAIQRAHEVSARVVERAHHVVERTQVKMAYPQPGKPIHINFVAPGGGNFAITVPVAPEPPTPTVF